MMKFIMPIILIGISVTLFFSYTNPIYSEISGLRAQVTSYNEALSNSQKLESERDKLTTIYNGIDPNNLAKLQKMLPDNVDNIRLILEIEKIAAPYGMVLSNVKYDATNTSTPASPAGTVQGGGATATTGTSQDYGIFNLEFSTSGSYNNFISLTKDLESNLRMVDISSISFSSDSVVQSANSKTSSPDTYGYDFKIRTYWLKN